MSATKTIQSRGIKALVIGLLAILFLTFMTPVDAFASANNGVPEVTVSPDGIAIEGTGFDGGDGASAWTQILTKYRVFIIGISGIAAITMVVIFIFQFLKLGASAGNPQGRSQALVGLLWSGIAAAGLGAVSLIVGLFYRAV